MGTVLHKKSICIVKALIVLAYTEKKTVKKQQKRLVQPIYLHNFVIVILKTIFFTLNPLIPIKGLRSGSLRG